MSWSLGGVGSSSRLVAAAVLLPLLFAACGNGEVQRRIFEAELRPLNGSGVSGEATVLVREETMTVVVEASGLVANKVHPLHIHGFGGEREATCPSAGAGGDDLLDAAEGESSYGPVRISLEPFPSAGDEGRIAFQVSYGIEPNEIGQTVPRDQVTNLSTAAIVLHGLTVEGAYRGSVPVACGELSLVTES